MIEKLRESTGKVRNFVEETASEVRKANWPGREELTESTMVVIVTLILVSLFVGVCDWILIGVLKYIAP